MALHGHSPLRDNTNATSLHSQAGKSHRQRNTCLPATLAEIHLHASQIHWNRWHRHAPLCFATKAFLHTTILIHSQHQAQISLTLSSVVDQRVAISSTPFHQASFYPSHRSSPAILSSLQISTPFPEAGLLQLIFEDGDSIVRSMWNTPESLQVQDRGANPRSGGIFNHRRGGVAAGSCDLVLQASEGTSHHAPPQPRCVSPCCKRNPVLRDMDTASNT